MVTLWRKLDLQMAFVNDHVLRTSSCQNLTDEVHKSRFAKFNIVNNLPLLIFIVSDI